MLLGFRAVHSTTLATCLIDAMPSSNHLDYGRFWQFSVGVGMLAEVLARSEGLAPEEAFTAGVLHNIGRLALDQRVPEGFAHSVRHAKEHRISLDEAEHDVLGYSDNELGAALCTHWSFPPPLVDAVANHVLDADALPDPNSLTAAVVRARISARAYGLSDGVEIPAGAAPDPRWETPPLSIALQRAGGVDGVLEARRCVPRVGDRRLIRNRQTGHREVPMACARSRPTLIATAAGGLPRAP